MGSRSKLGGIERKDALLSGAVTLLALLLDSAVGEREGGERKMSGGQREVDWREKVRKGGRGKGRGKRIKGPERKLTSLVLL